MMKRLLATLVAIGMATHIAGCTSSAPKDETDVATSGDENFTEEKSADFQDETQSAEQPVGDQPPASDLAVEENLELEGDQQQASAAQPEGDLSLDDADPEHEFPDNVAQAPPSVDGLAPEAAPPPSDENLFASNAPPPTDAPPAEAPPPDPAAAEPPPADPVANEAPPSSPKPSRSVAYSPLLKIKDQPFTQKGALLNRVYIARQSDTWKSVSEKIYGMNDSAKLKSWNPALAGRGLKVGDKVYYNSPRDASDNARMLTYYEDMGIPAQSYVTKDGDNLRAVGQELLGHKDSWKELWVTNRDLASKGALPAGIEVRYWPDGGVAAPPPTQTVASNSPPAPPPMPPGPGPNDGLVPPPTGDQPMMDPLAAAGGQPGGPPTDPNATGAAGAVAPPPEPPPPPPPPPVAAAPKKPKAVEPVEPAAGEQDTMMMLGAGGILLLAAVATFVVMRKNRAKRIDLSQTQV